MKHAIGAPYWDKKPVVLVGGGPSLRDFDFKRLLDLNAWLVGVNESIFSLPRCDVGVTVDKVFVEKRFDRLRAKIATGMEMIIATPTPALIRNMNATVLTRQLTHSLSDESHILISCGTSGYGAMNVAYLKRARRILLLGYDYSANGLHYHEEYEWFTPPKRADCWSFWAAFYKSMLPQLEAAGVEVFNASPKSTIKTFQKGTIDEGLQWLDPKAPRRIDIQEEPVLFHGS
jgi:hypothetical protein